MEAFFIRYLGQTRTLDLDRLANAIDFQVQYDGSWPIVGVVSDNDVLHFIRSGRNRFNLHEDSTSYFNTLACEVAAEKLVSDLNNFGDFGDYADIFYDAELLRDVVQERLDRLCRNIEKHLKKQRSQKNQTQAEMSLRTAKDEITRKKGRRDRRRKYVSEDILAV